MRKHSLSVTVFPTAHACLPYVGTFVKIDVGTVQVVLGDHRALGFWPKRSIVGMLDRKEVMLVGHCASPCYACRPPCKSLGRPPLPRYALDVQQTVDKYLRGLNDNLYFVSSLEGIPRHNYASSCEKSRQNSEASRGTRAQSCTDPARKGEFIFGTLETHDLFKHCYVQKASQFNKIGYSHVPKPL